LVEASVSGCRFDSVLNPASTHIPPLEAMKTPVRVAAIAALTVVVAAAAYFALFEGAPPATVVQTRDAPPTPTPTAAYTAASGNSSARPALTVAVTTPASVELARNVAATGSIHPWQEASVGAEGQGWRLAEVRAQVGDTVRQGQVLAVFDTRVAQADLAALRASAAEAEATLAEAGANARRARELQTTGAISAQQVTQYLTAERTASARLEAQRAAVRAQELRLAQGTVTAPDDGIITSRHATVGAVVSPGHELFRLIRQGRLEWRAEVAAADLATLKPGMPVRVVPTGADPVTGTVRRIGPTVDTGTRNGLVYVDLPSAPGLRAGSFARGDFEIGRGQALTLPQTAILLREGFSWVFVVGDDSRVRQLKVGTGRRSGDRIEIVQGLEPGARVVVAGGGFLADGDLVRVSPGLSPDAPASAPVPVTTQGG
jgi:HlyD family secretion protein